MPPTKSELEAHRFRYNALISQARAALDDGHYSKAVEIASTSWQYVDGMMQYERRYEEKEFENIEGVDIVLDYAPLLFKFEKLDELDTLLKSQRRIDKNASDDLAAKLADARSRMKDAYRLWDCLERQASAQQSELRAALGGNQDQWRKLVESWSRMRILRQEPVDSSYRLSFVTRLDEPIEAKCFSCGAVSNAPKRDFLLDRSCESCNQTGPFVLLANSETAGASE